MTAEAEPFAAALLADGYTEPLPAVGQMWRDLNVTWLAPGCDQYVELTSIGKTIDGWQVRVRRWETAPDGTAHQFVGEGLLFLDHLIRGYEAPQPEGP